MSHELFFKGYIKGAVRAWVIGPCAQKGCSRNKAADEGYRCKRLGKSPEPLNTATST